MIRDQIERGRELVSLNSTAILVPGSASAEGLLVKSYGAAWIEVARHLGNDWTAAFKIEPRTWEEILAGALDKEGFKVTLTPRSGDYGRDVIAERSGIGSMRLIGSMKAYGPDHVVPREHIHEMLGIVNAEHATKGMIVTTSDFAPRIFEAPGLQDAARHRLELYNGTQLQDWLRRLTATSSS